MIRRILRFLLWAAALVIVVAVIALLQTFYRPTLLLNEVDRAIYLNEDQRWGAIVNLFPDIMGPESTRNAIDRKLSGAGYSKIQPSKVWARYSKRVAAGAIVYTKDASRLPCNITNYVFAYFNKDSKVTRAEATQHEHGCL